MASNLSKSEKASSKNFLWFAIASAKDDYTDSPMGIYSLMGGCLELVIVVLALEHTLYGVLR